MGCGTQVDPHTATLKAALDENALGRLHVLAFLGFLDLALCEGADSQQLYQNQHDRRNAEVEALTGPSGQSRE